MYTIWYTCVKSESLYIQYMHYAHMFRQHTHVSSTDSQRLEVRLRPSKIILISWHNPFKVGQSSCQFWIKNKIKCFGLAVSSAHNFSEHVFSWYVKQGKQGRLLLATGRSKELGRFVPVIQIFLRHLEVLVPNHGGQHFTVVDKLSLILVGWI